MPSPTINTSLAARAHAQPTNLANDGRQTHHATTPLSCSGGPKTPSSKDLVRRSSGSIDGGRGNNSPFADTTTRCRQGMIGSITSRIHTAAAVHGETFQEKKSCTVRARVCKVCNVATRRRGVQDSTGHSTPVRCQALALAVLTCPLNPTQRR